LDDVTVGGVALQLQNSHSALSPAGMKSKRVPHFHWTSVELGTIIGKGAVGSVFIGKVNGHARAIKKLRCDVLDKETVNAVTHEVEVSWLLSECCPGSLIVKCTGFSLNPPDLHVIMEICVKGSLMHVLEAQDLGYLQRLKMAFEVMCAVAHMHELNFVHRDLKSLNFFVTDHDQLPVVRLGDFGETVTISEAASEKPAQAGSLKWMAPEIIENWKWNVEGSVYTTAADTFSATVVVWECLTSQEPYTDTRAMSSGGPLRPVQLMDAVVGGLRPSTGSIPNGQGGAVSVRLQNVVECGWHHDPAERYSAEHICRILEDERKELSLIDQLSDKGGQTSLKRNSMFSNDNRCPQV